MTIDAEDGKVAYVARVMCAKCCVTYKLSKVGAKDLYDT